MPFTVQLSCVHLFHFIHLHSIFSTHTHSLIIVSGPCQAAHHAPKREEQKQTTQKPGNLYFFQTRQKMGTNRVISIAGCFIVTMPKCFPMLPLWRIDLPFHGTHTVLSCRLSTLNDETFTGVVSGLMRLDQAQSVRHVWLLCIHTHTHTDIHSSLYSNHSRPWLSDLPCCSPQSRLKGPEASSTDA